MENSTYVKYFEDMIEYLKFYDLTVNEFKTYYLRLSHAIEKGFIKRPLKYIWALLDTRVKPILTKRDEEIFNFVKTGLSALLLQTFKDPNNSKMLDDYYRNEFAKMKQLISLNNISFEMFTSYYSLINMAVDIPTKSIGPTELISSIRLLFNVKVETLTSQEFKRLTQMKAKLEKKYNSFLNGEIAIPKAR